MAETLSVQWFPGHMAKTRRMMAANLKLVDLVVELTDARIPMSSRNPEVDRIVGKKPRIVLLNKSDSADDAVTQKWLNWYRSRGIVALATDCRSGKGLKAFTAAAKEVLADKLAQWEQKGMGGRPIRMMIVGIPNVGKSSLINRLAGSKRAKVEDRPGVTRGKQWVTLDSGMELLDMPGVLWPKFEDKEAGERLAFVGSVKDDILDVEYLAMRLLEVLREPYGDLVAQQLISALNMNKSFYLPPRFCLLETAQKGILHSGFPGSQQRGEICAETACQRAVAEPGGHIQEGAGQFR